MSQLPISVCITTKNSVDTIEECLQSVVEWVDEIVVLDCNSTDGTLDICEKYGATIYQHEFKGFTRLKQKAINKVKNEWVLILDADEIVSEALRKEIGMKLGKNSAFAYYIPFKTQMFGKWMHITPEPKPRLAKKRALLFKGTYVHEGIAIKKEFHNKTEKLSSPIYHYTYEDVSDYMKKFDQYTSLEALRKVEDGRAPSFFWFLIKGCLVFLYHLFYQYGLLDGWQGVFFAFMSFQYQIVTYDKIKELKKLGKERPKDWKEIWMEEKCQR